MNSRLRPLRIAVTVLAVMLFAFTARTMAQNSAVPGKTFPKSTAQAQDLKAETLAKLNDLVKGFVDQEDIVGGELLVIKNGYTVLHEAHGWRNREAEVPMVKGSVFCVRSMTKPLISTAIMMLVEEGKIKLEDRAAKYLPSFAGEGSREIKIKHLLRHTSGLPLSLLMGQDLQKLKGIRAVADLGGAHKIESNPGSKFTYSDQGTDTLTAIIEVVTKKSAAEFVQTRILDALGMTSSAPIMSKGHPLRQRGCSKYMGQRGAWTEFWNTGKPAIFPFFLGSQGLYSTVEDYARFLDFWNSQGRVGGKQILSANSVAKVLTPNLGQSIGGSGFKGVDARYGWLMQLWTRDHEKTKKGDKPFDLVAFGHSGSDGTYAWVFPEQNAMVFYFTQSRGNITGLKVAEVLGELFLGQAAVVAQVAPPKDQYLGYYWEGEGDKYRAIIRDGEDLALEIPGRMIVPLEHAEDDRWKFRQNPAVVISFDRDREGKVTGYHIGDHQEFRFTPSDKLPKGEKIAELVAKTHRIDLMEKVGPIRLNSSLTIKKFGIEGKIRKTLAWPNRFRVDTEAGKEFERLAFNGKSLLYVAKDSPTVKVEGAAAALIMNGSYFNIFGDWRKSASKIQVIQKLKKGEMEIYLVRLGDCSAPAQTMFVHWKTGRVFRQEGMTHVNPLGRIGQRISFADFRDVSGMLLPFKSEIQSVNPMAGIIATEVIVEDFKLGVEIPIGTFELK